MLSSPRRSSIQTPPLTPAALEEWQRRSMRRIKSGWIRRSSAIWKAVVIMATVGSFAAADEATSPQDLMVPPPDCHGLPWDVHVQIGLQDTRALLYRAPSKSQHRRRRPCSVAWMGHSDITLSGMKEALLNAFDYVLTDSFEVVPFASRSGRLAFLERVGQIYHGPEPDDGLIAKEHLLSVLLPSEDSTAWDDPFTRQIHQEAMEHMPEHTFTNDGTIGTHLRAFSSYRFSLIVDDEGYTVSEALIRCLGFQAVPLFNGFTSFTVMTSTAVLPLNKSHFHLPVVMERLMEMNNDVGWLWHYNRMLQDQLTYRYVKPFDDRFASAACTLCRHEMLARSRASTLPPSWTAPPKPSGGDEDVAKTTAPQTNARKQQPHQLVFVAVLSAMVNFEKRQAVRDTWGRVLREVYGFPLRFFIGESNARADFEAATYNDLVVLNVPEGYAMNSKKGLLLLQWCAFYYAAEFLLKVDDDIYLRPAPVVAVLRRRPPFGHIWGYFDYMSPVPRIPGEPFYSDEDTFPFPTFPPYPRGLVRAISFDVVRRLAEAGRQGRLRMIFGDDPCLGVHLRQLLFSTEEDEQDGACPLPLLTLDDRDSYRSFAMEPSCSDRLWSHVTPRTWVVHHVTAEHIRCMFAADVAAGYYDLVPTVGRVEDEDADETADTTASVIRLSSAAEASAEMAAEVATAGVGKAPDVPPMPDVCSCLAVGPLAEALANRSDKITASQTFKAWGDPNAVFD
eukprot:TRINITY_DN67923_c0_g1_i1.p1 TRINITY_DN67923_c0_g1~~TRINITY_DN67923_c0_g1_i1.p1  ORF type:complete len:732 (-),score=110.33 TRINITY_DN67923_c0_g1_i1:47-2242(-)